MKFASRCKGGFPAGGNFFACPVAASKRGCTASGLRSDQPIWTARGALPIKTDQGWKAMMEPWNCRGAVVSDADVPFPPSLSFQRRKAGGERPAVPITPNGRRQMDPVHVSRNRHDPKPADEPSMPAFQCYPRSKHRAASTSRNLRRYPAPSPAGRWRGPAALNGARFNWGAASHCHPAADQSSTVSP